MKPRALSRAVPLALAVALLASAPAARADDTAALAYRQAEQLAQQGKWAEACPLYDASYRADPEIGVLLHLADCHEHVGRFASAWAEFNDAVELAHRRGDNREALAQSRADALKPKLAYLHLVAPATVAPGLVVRRDGLDVTVLVGTDMPIDPGDHEIAATAPGYLDWRKKLTIGTLPTTTQLAIPSLEKAPVQAPASPPPPIVHEGTLEVTSEADAHISLDGAEVGVGRYRHTVKSGGHQLRVTAPGMRAYQSEIVVADGETRTIEVPLEKDQAIIVAAPPHEDLPSFELGLGFAPGIKGNADHPAVLSYRFDFGFRFGRRVNFGAFAEYGSVSTAGTCGTSIPGPMPASPYDFGTHYRFDSCFYALAGLQLYVHILPRRRIDPYVGIAPGFRFGNISYTPFDSTGMALQSQSSSAFEPGISIDARAGVDYHPYPALPGWAIGGFIDVQSIPIAEEGFGHGADNASYESFFAGLRTSLAL